MKDYKLRIWLKKIICLIFIFFFTNLRAEESYVLDDWLINFDDNVCWATALITEDPFNDEYELSKDFQFTVSFHNGDTVATIYNNFSYSREDCNKRNCESLNEDKV